MKALGRRLANQTSSLKLLFSEPALLRKWLAATRSGYLLDTGWIVSAAQGSPVDPRGRPLPWLTYPMIEFLNERLSTDMHMFEFGGGNSTLYFAGRVSDVTTVEHDPKWAAYLRRRVPDNCTLIVTPLAYGGDYSRAAKTAGRRFDIVLVDGRDRVNCALSSVETLSDRGVIIFDDFERAQYQSVAERLEDGGFRQISFWGMKPGLIKGSNTALFYRADNVFRL